MDWYKAKAGLLCSPEWEAIAADSGALWASCAALYHLACEYAATHETGGTVPVRALLALCPMRRRDSMRALERLCRASIVTSTEPVHGTERSLYTGQNGASTVTSTVTLRGWGKEQVDPGQLRDMRAKWRDKKRRQRAACPPGTQGGLSRDVPPLEVEGEAEGDVVNVPNGTLSNWGLEPPTLDVASKKKNPRSLGPEVQAVYRHWQTVMGRSASRLTVDRRQKIETRLREGYSVADLRRAIDGCAASSFHMGENDRGRRYSELCLILRTGSKVEEFMALADEGAEQERREHLQDLVARRDEINRALCALPMGAHEEERDLYAERDKVTKAMGQLRAEGRGAANGAARS